MVTPEVPPGSDSSDARMRQALAGFPTDVGPAGLAAALTSLDAASVGAGSRLADYRLLHELGRGGMGVVFAAEQLSVPGRRVAVKLLPGLQASAAARARFAREVAVIGRLDHPGIVPILSAEVDGPTPFFAMKLVEGQSLRALLQQRALVGQIRRLAELVRDVARAVHHAHSHGVVHRDVKPGNILVDRHGRAQLLDFGLAFDVDAASTLTMTSDAVGTPDYMAPEQIDRRLGPVSVRTDVYGLGATLYECLTSSPPFRGASRHELMARILDGRPRSLRACDRSIPADLANICTMAMEADPARRYASAAELADDLDAFLQHRAVRARPPAWLRRVRMYVQRHRLAVGAIGLIALAASASAGWWGVLLPRAVRNERLAAVDRLQTERLDLLASLATAVTDERAVDASPHRVLQRGVQPAGQRRSTVLRQQLARLDSEIENLLEVCHAVDPTHREVRQRFARFLADRLRELLRGGGQVTRREQVRQCEQRLARMSDDSSHAALLRGRGRLEVTHAAGPARVVACPSCILPDGRADWVAPGATGAIDLGTTPVSVELDEGVYRLHASFGARVDVRVPVLVNRGAVQEPGEPLVELEFLRPEQLVPGFVQVHGGIGIGRPVEDDEGGFEPAELVAFAGFQMSERELRSGEVERWTGAPLEANEPADGSVRVRDLTWNRIVEVLGRLNAHEAAVGSGYYVSLPTPDEWLRAGQGVDARPYPWGWIHDWSFSQNYWTSTNDRHRLRPEVWPEADCSPFGVRDLAGSLREVCVPARALPALGTKQLRIAGGSFLATTPQALLLATSQMFQHNEPSSDVGLRLVRRPLPPLPTGPSRLRLAETVAADDANPGSVGWRLVGMRTPLWEQIAFSAYAARTDAGLLVRGLEGSFSHELLCWHGIDLAGDRATAHLHLVSGVPAQRSIAVRFGTRPGLETHDQCITVLLGAAGCRLLAPTGSAHVPWTAPSGPIDVAIVVGPNGVAASVSFQGRTLAELDVPGREGLPARWHYFGVVTPTMVGLDLLLGSLVVEGR